MKSAYLKPLIGVLIIAATLVSFSYIITTGIQNESNYQETVSVKKLSATNRDLNDQITALNDLNLNTTSDLNLARKDLANVYSFINNKNNIDLSSTYKDCATVNLPQNANDVTAADITKYTNILYSKAPDIKKYMAEVTPVYVKRFVQINDKDDQYVTYNVGAINVAEIQPQCVTNIIETRKLRLEIKTSKLEEFS